MIVQLEDFIEKKYILTNLAAGNKEEALREMLAHLESMDEILEPNICFEDLLEREDLMSTGVKQGFAIPHAFTSQIDKPILCIGITQNGIDFRSLDDEPVHIIFMLLSPKSSQGIHLELLARLSRLMNNREFFKLIMNAKNEQDALEIIRREDKKMGS